MRSMARRTSPDQVQRRKMQENIMKNSKYVEGILIPGLLPGKAGLNDTHEKRRDYPEKPREALEKFGSFQ